MKRSFPKVAVITSVFALAGCASDPEKIDPTHVPISMYSSLSCEQLQEEMHHLNAKLLPMVAKQKTDADTDTAMVAVGVVVFWPALFLLAATEDNSEQISYMKGQYDSIIQSGIRENCQWVADVRQAEQEQREKELAAAKQEPLPEKCNVMININDPECVRE